MLRIHHRVGHIVAALALVGAVAARADSVLVTESQDGNVYALARGGTPTPVLTFDGSDYMPALVFDKDGNLYVGHNGMYGDYFYSQVTEISTNGTSTSQDVSTVVDDLYAMTVDGQGNVFVGTNASDQVSKLTPAGNLSVYATGVWGPRGLAFDANGNLWAVTALSSPSYPPPIPGGALALVTLGNVSYNYPGLNGPTALAGDTLGNVFVAVQGDGTVIKVTPGGNVSTFVSGLSGVNCLSFESNGTLLIGCEGGNIYAADTVGNVSLWSATGLTDIMAIAAVPAGLTGAPAITQQPQPVRIAPGGTATFTVKATGTALRYQWYFNGNPLNDGGAVSGSGTPSLHISPAGTAALGNYTLQVVNLTGSVSSAAAELTMTVTATYGAGVNSQGSLFFIDPYQHTIGRVSASGKVTPGTVSFVDPEALVFDQNGNLLISDNGAGAVYRITPAGQLSLYAANLQSPGAVTVNPAGHVFVTTTIDVGSISEIVSGAGAKVLLGGMGPITGLAAAPDNSTVYISVIERGGVAAFAEDMQGNVTELSLPSGGPVFPYGLVVDGAGTLYAADNETKTVYRYIPGGSWSRYAEMLRPDSVAVDETGVLYAGAQLLDGEGILHSAIYKVTKEGNVTLLCNPVGSAVSVTLAWAPKITDATGGVGPSIDAQPVSVTTGLGKSVTFQVKASGQEPLSYQWQFNATNIPGATKAAYTISRVSDNNAGAYNVVVNNAWGTANSVEATLDVLAPPVILSQPQAASVEAKTNVVFSVSASGQDLSYQWLRNGLRLQNKGNVAGATSATLSLAQVNMGNAGLYQVVVNNPGGSARSLPARLLLVK